MPTEIKKHGRFGEGGWCAGWDRVETPIGEPCLHCEEPIGAGDSGETTGYVAIGQPPKYVPQHKECLVRRIVGSVGHQLKKCSCHGGDYEDPPGLTKREAALCAFGLYYSRGFHAARS